MYSAATVTKPASPSAKLPSTAITLVYRSDSSGTTAVFTDYLSGVSPAFKASPGEGKSTLVANMAFALSQLQRVLHGLVGQFGAVGGDQDAFVHGAVLVGWGRALHCGDRGDISQSSVAPPGRRALT